MPLTRLTAAQNAIFVRQDLAGRLGDARGPESVNRLYLDALSLNWNDLLLNIAATRRGALPALVKAEMDQFGEISQGHEDGLLD